MVDDVAVRGVTTSWSSVVAVIRAVTASLLSIVTVAAIGLTGDGVIVTDASNVSSGVVAVGALVETTDVAEVSASPLWELSASPVREPSASALWSSVHAAATSIMEMRSVDHERA
jgi:hypothetical protein